MRILREGPLVNVTANGDGPAFTRVFSLGLNYANRLFIWGVRSSRSIRRIGRYPWGPGMLRIVRILRISTFAHSFIG